MPGSPPPAPRSSLPQRHRWGINLWVTPAEEAKIRVYFADRIESLAEAAKRLLLAEIACGGTVDKSVTQDINDALRDYQQVKNVLNGDPCKLNEATPVARRIHDLLSACDPATSRQFSTHAPRL